MKQMSWLSGFSATESPRSAASWRIAGLGGVTDRERGVAQLLSGQHAEHIGLVLVDVDRAAQPALGEPGVVPGGHRIEAQGQRLGRQRGELDLLVAAHAWLGVSPRS